MARVAQRLECAAPTRCTASVFGFLAGEIAIQRQTEHVGGGKPSPVYTLIDIAGRRRRTLCCS